MDLSVYEISRTPVPEIAWKRAGLAKHGLPKRELLADCTLRELYSLATTQATTEAGQTFTANVGVLIRYLEGWRDKGPFDAFDIVNATPEQALELVGGAP